MAITNTLNTRIALKYDLLTNWNASSLVLKKGEIAIAEIPSQNNIIGDAAHTPENAPPAIAMKVGDGTKTFKQLPWVQAVAGDVYAWAKKANTPTLGELTNIDADLKTEVDKIIGQHGEIVDTDTYYKVETNNDKIGGKHHFKLSAYKKDGTADTSKDIVINWSDLDTWMADETDRVQGLIESAFSTLVPQTAAGEGKFVSAVDQVDGKIKVTRSNLVATDITDMIPQAKVTGLETLQSEFNTAKDQLANTDGTISSSNKLMTASAVQRDVENAIDTYKSGLTETVSGSGDYVTNVTQADGKVTVTKASLTHDKITDWDAEVTQKLAAKQNNLPFSDDTQPSEQNYVIRKNDIADLAGAMHFEGIVDAIPPTGNYNAGDLVILKDTNKEYVFDGTNWLELGDEGTHATKAALEAVEGRVQTLETNHPKDVETLRGEIATAKSEAISTAQTNTESHVSTELSKLNHASSGSGKFVTSVTQANGKVTVVNSTMTYEDIDGDIPQSKITNLESDLAGKQAKLAAIDGGEASVTTDNPVATKATVASAIEASEAKLHAIATSGNVKDLVQTTGEVLFFNCGSSTEVI